MEREREHKKRGGESNGVDCDGESGDQTGVGKVVPKWREGEGGAEGRRKEGMEVRAVPTTKKQKTLLLAEHLLSSCVFFFGF
jgi:hypothetical protein